MRVVRHDTTDCYLMFFQICNIAEGKRITCLYTIGLCSRTCQIIFVQIKRVTTVRLVREIFRILADSLCQKLYCVSLYLIVILEQRLALLRRAFL